MRGLFVPRDLVESLNSKSIPAQPIPRRIYYWVGDGSLATIGAHDCWCGEEQGHVWPHQEDGAPHPRTPPFAIEVEKEVTVMVDVDRLERKQIGGFSASVATALTRIVNEMGVKYRIQDPNHILLFPPDGTTRPFKVSASRPATASLRFLEGFVKDHGLTVPEKETPKNGEAFVRTPPPAPVPVAPDVSHSGTKFNGPTPAEIAKSLRQNPKPEPVDEGVLTLTEGWTRAIGRENKPLNWETLDANIEEPVWRCMECRDEGNVYETSNRRTFGGHTRTMHRDTSTLRTPESQAKAHATRRANLHGKAIVDALMLLAETTGVQLGDGGEVDALKKEIVDLKAKLEKAEAERDDAVTRVKLLKEAFSGLGD